MVVSVRERSLASPALVRLRVVPGSRRSELVGRHGDAWKLRVHAPAERGKANDEVVRLLAGTLGVPRSSVRIVRGHSSADKLVEVSEATSAQVEQRLAAARETT